MDTLVTHVNVEAGARALAPADFHYIEFWSGSRTMVGSGEKSARANIEHARRQARTVLEAVQAAREGSATPAADPRSPGRRPGAGATEGARRDL